MRFEPSTTTTQRRSGGLPRGLIVLLGAASAVGAIAGMKAAASIVGPVFFALTLTVAVRPMQRWLRGKGFPVWATILAALTVVYGILAALVAGCIYSIARFATLLPTYEGKFDDLIAQGRRFVENRGVGSEQVDKALNFDANRVFSVVSTALDNSMGVFTALTFISTLLLFMTIDGATYERRLQILQRMRPDIAYALTEFSEGTRKYLVVSTVFGLIVAVFDTVALWWIGIPLPIAWGLLSFITNYIPNIGFVLGLIPPALLGLLEGGFETMLLVIVVYIVINTVIQSFIQPKFVGDTVEISPTMTVLALVFWSWVLGAYGTFLAIPLTLMVKALLFDIDPDTRWVDSMITNNVKELEDRDAEEADQPKAASP